MTVYTAKGVVTEVVDHRAKDALSPDLAEVAERIAFSVTEPKPGPEAEVLSIYDIRAMGRALHREIKVRHASDMGDEARAFTLSGRENDVRKVASILISTSGAFLQVGHFRLVERGLSAGTCELDVIMAPDIKGIPRRVDPSYDEVEGALFDIISLKVPPGNRALAIAIDAARRVLHLPDPAPKELS